MNLLKQNWLKIRFGFLALITTAIVGLFILSINTNVEPEEVLDIVNRPVAVGSGNKEEIYKVCDVSSISNSTELVATKLESTDQEKLSENSYKETWKEKIGNFDIEIVAGDYVENEDIKLINEETDLMLDSWYRINVSREGNIIINKKIYGPWLGKVYLVNYARKNYLLFRGGYGASGGNSIQALVVDGGGVYLGKLYEPSADKNYEGFGEILYLGSEPQILERYGSLYLCAHTYYKPPIEYTQDLLLMIDGRANFIEMTVE